VTSANGNGDRWKVTKEKFLMFSGLFSFFFQLVHVQVLGGVLHYEFLLGSLALCGVSIAWWSDKK